VTASPSRKRVLITGAAGFIGSALGRRLEKSGHRVEGLDLAGADELGFPLSCGDVLDVGLLDRLCEEVRPDVIVHAGGISGRSVARERPDDVLTINTMGTLNVFERARRHNVPRVILCSSGSVYGRTAADPVAEDGPTIPLNAYGASKVAAESIMHAYAEFGIEAAALRIFQAYGPGRRTRCILRLLIEAAQAGRVAEPPYRPDATFQFVHIEDVVGALASAATAAALPRRIYNVAGGTSLRLDEVVAIAREVLPDLQLRWGDDPLSSEYCLRAIALSAAEQDLAYRPGIGLREGIARYAGHLTARA